MARLEKRTRIGKHMKNRWQLPSLGLGLGLRGSFAEEVIEQRPQVGFFEIISENYLRVEGDRMAKLEQIAERYPIVMHGVSLSIGSTDPLDLDYLRALRQLADRIGAKWVSDHVCWTGVAGKNTHDLLPVPLTERALEHVSERVHRVGDVLGRPLFLENPTSYLALDASTMPEAEFMMRLCERSGCGMLLDINNVYVNAFNHGFDAGSYVDSIDPDRVVQIHIAGHSFEGTHILDTHDAPVSSEVWRLYRRYVDRAGQTSTLLERDANVPPLGELVSELNRAGTPNRQRSEHAASV